MDDAHITQTVRHVVKACHFPSVSVTTPLQRDGSEKKLQVRDTIHLLVSCRLFHNINNRNDGLPSKEMSFHSNHFIGSEMKFLRKSSQKSLCTKRKLCTTFHRNL